MENKMKQCIICKEWKNESEFNKEHIIPESIGGSLIIDNVCKECNNKLGNTTDNILTENFLIKGELVRRKIKNKNNKEQVLFSKLTNISNPKIKLKPKKDKETGKFIRYETNTSVEEIDINQFNIAFDGNREIEEISKQVQNIFKKKYNKTFNKEERDKLKYLLENKRYVTNNDEFKCDLTIDFKKLSKPFIKIAYETAYYLLGESYLNDSYGNKLLKSLLNNDEKLFSEYGEKSLNLIGTIEWRSLFEEIEKITQMPLIHLILIFRKKNEIYLFINLFNIVSNCILITENAEIYDFNEFYNLITFYYKTYLEKDKKWFEEYNGMDLAKKYVEYYDYKQKLI